MKITVNKDSVFIDCVDGRLLKELDNLLSYNVKGAYFSKQYRDGHWDGKKHLFNTKQLSFKTGLLFRVLEYLKLSNIEYEIVDNRGLTFKYQTEHIDNDYEIGKNIISLRDVQKEAIYAYMKEINELHFNRGLLSLPPRSGKTIIMGVLGKTLNRYPILFIVHKIDLALQTKKVFEGIFDEKIGIVGDGECNVKSNIVVSTIQSICSAYGIKEKFEFKEKKGDYKLLKDFVSSAKVIMIDEAHVSGSESFQQLPSKLIHAEHIIGCTGTPFRTDGDDMLIEQLCGSIVYDLSRKDVQDKGYILPIKAHFIQLPPIASPSLEWKTQKKYALNENKYLLEGVTKLVKYLEDRGKSSLIIVNEKSQGSRLYKLIKCKYIHGNVSGYVREKVYGELNRKKILTLISTVTDVGVDIPSLDCVIMAGICKSKVSALQRIRCGTPFPGKEYGHLFVFVPTVIGAEESEDNYLHNHGLKLINIYKKEGFIMKYIDYNKIINYE